MEVKNSSPHIQLPSTLNVTNTFAIPNDAALRLAYEVYKPSNETKKLKSERGRKLFCETFIEHENLGTLSDLCAATMATNYMATTPLPSLVSDDALKMRIYYDRLSVDLPLEKIIPIDDEKYWRRVVQTKDKEKAFEKNCNWKQLGIAIRYAELIESHVPEYWPAEEIEMLAHKVKVYVRELHLRRLRSRMERSFEEYFESSSEEEYVEEDESGSWILPVVATKQSEEIDENNQKEDDENEEKQSEAEVEESETESVGEKTEKELRLETEEVKVLEAREAQLTERREAAEKVIDAKREHRRERAAKWLAAQQVPPPPPRRRRIKFKGVFDIPIEDESEDDDVNVADNRNLKILYERKKRYNYPPEDCHHVDLSFLRIFDNLLTLNIEFLGPQQSRDYHPRHLNFSYYDMERLARALKDLKHLKTFRLRNSRMDAKKVEILVDGLKELEELETLDFGYDQLKDDFGYALYTLFKTSTSIKALELEGNEIGNMVLRAIAVGLGKYDGILDYLGLAHNPLGAEGFHVLVNTICGTEHVKHLRLNGTQLGQATLVCCIANELLRKHQILRNLDLSGIHFGSEAGAQLITALNLNEKILQMDCRHCGLVSDIETDVVVCLRRNQYIANNPYLGDPTKTADEVEAYVSRVKNPILLNAMKISEERYYCMTNRPMEFDYAAHTSYIRMQNFLRKIRLDPTIKDDEESVIETDVETLKSMEETQCNFRYTKLLDFVEEELLERYFLPGCSPEAAGGYFREGK